jgi:hypothetical protein
LYAKTWKSFICNCCLALKLRSPSW